MLPKLLLALLLIAPVGAQFTTGVIIEQISLSENPWNDTTTATADVKVICYSTTCPPSTGTLTVEIGAAHASSPRFEQTFTLDPIEPILSLQAELQITLHPDTRTEIPLYTAIYANVTWDEVGDQTQNSPFHENGFTAMRAYDGFVRFEHISGRDYRVHNPSNSTVQVVHPNAMELLPPGTSKEFRFIEPTVTVRSVKDPSNSEEVAIPNFDESLDNVRIPVPTFVPIAALAMAAAALRRVPPMN